MKKMAIIGPCLPERSDKEALINSLGFLSNFTSLDYYDPFDSYEPNDNHEVFVSYWQKRILNMANRYDYFIGFSLGGMLIKKCLANNSIKPSLLFSTPTVIDKQLHKSLTAVISLLHQNRNKEAIYLHNKLVHAPYDSPEPMISEHKYPEVRQRLTQGLSYVLNMGNISVEKNRQKLMRQFVGESSALVTLSHIPMNEKACTFVVPKAGMRMLQNNPSFCQSHILEFLKEHN